MNVIKKTNSGIQSLSLDAVLLDERLVFLSEVITSASVALVVKQLLFLEALDEHEKIKLIINSPGGEVSAGLFLYTQMKGMNVPVEVYCTEIAASMAAIILAGGKHGRYILKSGRVMVHEPLISPSSGGISGSASQIARTAETILDTKRHLNELLANDTNHSIDEIEKIVAGGDRWFSAEEAVEFGICDALVDRV